LLSRGRWEPGARDERDVQGPYLSGHSKDAAVRAAKGGDAQLICAELRAALGY
jgi:hypothetical protein